MANILGVQTINSVWVIEVDADPTTGGGTDAPLGSIALTNNGVGTFTKTGILATDWTADTGVGEVSGDVELDFGNIQGGDGNATLTIASLLITNTNIKSFSYVQKSNADHDLDDFVGANIVFAIQNIQDNVSFDIVARVPNPTWGKFRIAYKIII